MKHPVIYTDDLATKARAMIRDFNLRILPVVNGDKKVVGVISRGIAMTISSSISPIRAKGIMSHPSHLAGLEDDVFLTVKEMLRLDQWKVPVVSSIRDKTYKGVFGLGDLIEALIKISPEKFSRDVSEIMSADVVSCSADDEVDNVWRLMQNQSFAGLPVVKKERLLGIVTQKDLLKSGALFPTFESGKGRFRASSKISSIMKTGVVNVKPTIKVIRVAKVMVSKNIGRVPVTDEDGKLIGIVDREDIARLIVR